MFSKKNLSAVPEPTEIVVHSHEIWERDGRAFRLRIEAALENRPHTLLVHIIAGTQLRLSAVTTLLQMRRKARAQGVRFLVRPSNRAVIGHLRSIGLERVLAHAA